MATDGSDDPTIVDTAQLWRRIPSAWVVFDENLRRNRPSSQAFNDHPDGSGMSVVLGDDLLASGRQPENALAGNANHFLASILAGLARECRQLVCRRPTAAEPAHAEVVGKKTASVRNQFARAARWIIPPPDLTRAERGV
jgi:hypothetical protein